MSNLNPSLLAITVQAQDRVKNQEARKKPNNKTKFPSINKSETQRARPVVSTQDIEYRKVEFGQQEPTISNYHPFLKKRRTPRTIIPLMFRTSEWSQLQSWLSRNPSYSLSSFGVMLTRLAEKNYKLPVPAQRRRKEGWVHTSFSIGRKEKTLLSKWMQKQQYRMNDIRHAILLYIEQYP